MSACWRCGGSGVVGCVDYTDPCPCCEPARTSAGPADLLPRALASAIDAGIDACEHVRRLLDRLHEHSLEAPDCVTCPRCSAVLGSTTAPLHVYHFRGADLVSFSRGGE